MLSVSSSAVLVSACQTVFYTTAVWILLKLRSSFPLLNTKHLLIWFLALWPGLQGTAHFNPGHSCQLGSHCNTVVLFHSSWLMLSFWNFCHMLTHKEAQEPLFLCIITFVNLFYTKRILQRLKKNFIACVRACVCEHVPESRCPGGQGLWIWWLWSSGWFGDIWWVLEPNPDPPQENQAPLN